VPGCVAVAAELPPVNDTSSNGTRIGGLMYSTGKAVPRRMQPASYGRSSAPRRKTDAP